MKVTMTGLQEDIEAVGAFKQAALEDFFSQAIDKLIEISPVDTGAYIESHTLKSDTSRGRGRSSSAGYRTKGGGDPEVARALLEDDLSNLDFDSEIFVIRNDSPHANDVEEGGERWKRDGYHVYKELENFLKDLGVDAKKG